MNASLTLAQELRLVSAELSALEWGGIVLIGITILALLFVCLYLMPKMVSIERRSAARIIELLESIDRRLADRDQP
jgi:hypothetical protein